MRARAALQRLGRCADFSFQSRSEAHCGQAWGDVGGEVDAPGPAARTALSAQPDRAEARLQRSGDVRGALGDHSGQGSNLHYGCSLKHGRVQCSTY